MIRRAHIQEGEAGVLYRRGRHERLLQPGGHWLLGPGLRVDRVDIRRRLLVVGSQEIPTKDKVQLRLSAVVAYRVIDPPKALHDVESYEQELHVVTQLALRSVVAEATVEELLGRQPAAAERLSLLVSERAPALGLEVSQVDVRDVMLPGDVKAAFANILRAQAEGRAALERARGESAALRSLANSARLMESNPALMNLRLLQAISQDPGTPGTTRFVVNLPDSMTASSAGKLEPEHDSDEP